MTIKHTFLTKTLQDDQNLNFSLLAPLTHTIHTQLKQVLFFDRPIKERLSFSERFKGFSNSRLLHVV